MFLFIFMACVKEEVNLIPHKFSTMTHLRTPLNSTDLIINNADKSVAMEALEGKSDFHQQGLAASLFEENTA
jgi:hypothetical protein